MLRRALPTARRGLGPQAARVWAPFDPPKRIPHLFRPPPQVSERSDAAWQPQWTDCSKE